MDVPTPDDVRAWAPTAFDWAVYGMDDDAEGDARLTKRIEWGWGYIENITGRQLETLDASMVPLAEQALVLRAMQTAVGGGAAAVKLAEKPWLKSFTAGSYSETRFSPAELGGNSREVLLKINPWLELAMLLWLMMTEAKRAEWLAVFAGRVQAAGSFFELDMGARDLSGVGRIAEPYDEQGLIE